LAAWQVYSGVDASSQAHWFTLQAGDAPRSRIFYNDTNQSKIFSLGSTLYVDLDQNPVFGELLLAPYQSQILIETGQGADLALSMDLLSSADTAPGAALTYTISLSNQGLIAASLVSLENPLPAEIVNADWQASPGTVGLESGSRYTWEIDPLAVGETFTFTITGQYDAALTPGTPLLVTDNNQAIIRLGEWKYLYLPIVAR